MTIVAVAVNKDQRSYLLCDRSILRFNVLSRGCKYLRSSCGRYVIGFCGQLPNDKEKINILKSIDLLIKNNLIKGFKSLNTNKDELSDALKNVKKKINDKTLTFIEVSLKDFDFILAFRDYSFHFSKGVLSPINLELPKTLGSGAFYFHGAFAAGVHEDQITEQINQFHKYVSKDCDIIYLDTLKECPCLQ